MSNNIGIILASGIGQRFNAKIPKQIIKLNKRLIIEYSVNAMKKLDKIIIITNDICYKKILYLKQKYNVEIICKNTNSRNESIYESLMYIKKYNPLNVILHDSARPYIKIDHISKLINLSKKYDYIQYCMKLINGLGKIDNGKIIPVDRSKYIELCTPICMNYKKCINLYNSSTIELFDDMNKLNIKYKIVYDVSYYLKKITYNSDI